MASITERLSKAWNAFTSRDPTIPFNDYSYGSFSSNTIYRKRLGGGRDRTIINSIYNRIAVDIASVDILHAQLDDNNRFIEPIYSGLHECLTVTANIDQTGRQFILDAALTLLDEGVIAIVPIDKNISSKSEDENDYLNFRIGKIVQWYPQHVRINVYNERTGLKEDITISKSEVAIVENPFYSVMNEPNSTAQRLVRKLNLLDRIDNDNSSGRLDLILQLPYIVKTDAKKREAQKRLSEIEKQLKNTKYGIAYTDGTEKVVQLNRPIENQLLKQIEYLTDMLYGQLGITPEVIKGTASEQVMLNYYAHTIEPIMMAITEEMTRKFITKNNREYGEKIIFIRDPFKLVPVNMVADIADKFTRNEILTSNEVRGIIGFKPSNDPNADELRNKNLNQNNQNINNIDESYIKEE